MKKVVLTVLSLTVFFGMNAQWSGTNPISTLSRVGIGTTSPSWNSMLHVKSTASGWSHIIENNGTYLYSAFGNGADGLGMHIRVNNSTSSNYALQLYNGMDYFFHAANNGNIGIGTTNPISSYSGDRVLQLHSKPSNLDVHVKLTNNITGAGASDGFDIFLAGTGAANIINRENASLLFGTNNQTSMIIWPDGKIGIGTLYSPTSLLTVNGSFESNSAKIHGLIQIDGKLEAEEIEVKNIAADFVFDKNYKLRSLEEVEKFVKENKHLPDVAPASETAKGVNIAEFNTTLLQKVEELTLYIIEQNKKIDALQTKINTIK